MNEIEISQYQNLLVFKKGYTPQMIKMIIEEHGLSGLKIFDHLDPLTNVDFLVECSFLEGLAFAPRFEHSFEFLNYLPRLKLLDIQSEGNSEIDLSHLPLLESLVINWRKKIRGFEFLHSLVDLCLVDFKEPDVNLLRAIPSIETLMVKGSTIKSLDGVQYLSKLRIAYFGACGRLRSVIGINGSKYLEKLSFWSCPKITDFDKLNYLPQLLQLELVNCKSIPSILFIENFHKLEHLSLLGSTNVLDGNMHPALKVEQVYGATRRHYAPIIDDWAGNSPA